MHVIGLSGFAGAGKSTIAEYLVREHGFVRMSFAMALKDITAIAFGWDRQRLEGATPQDRIWREEPDPFWSERMGKPFTPRYALQFIGTDVFRNHVVNTIWSDLIIAKIRHVTPNTNVVIDDVRFVNERQALQTVGAKFLLIRRDTFPSSLHEELWNAGRSGTFASVDTTTIQLHPSEWQWLHDQTVADDPVLVNSGSYDDLYQNVDIWYTNITSSVVHVS